MLANAEYSNTFNKIVTYWLIGFAISLETGIFLSQVFAAFGGILVIYTFLKKNTIRSVEHGATFFLLLTIIAFLISAFSSADIIHSLLKIAKKFLLPLTGFFSVLILINTTRQRSVMLHALLISGGVGALIGLFQYFTGIDPIYGQYIPGPMRGTTIPVYSAKGLLNMSLTYSGVQSSIFLFLLPFVWEKRGKKNIWYWIIILLLFVTSIFTLKRSPMIAIAFASMFFIFSKGKKAGLTAIIAGIILLLGLYAGSSAFRVRIDETIYMKTPAESDRLYLWKAAIDMGVDSPVCGVGIGHWSHHVHEYLPVDREFQSVAHPHSDPMFVWATTGIIGVIAISGLLFMLFQSGIKDLRRYKSPRNEWLIYSGGMFALLGFVVMSMFQCYMTDGENIFMLAVLMGFALNARNALLIEANKS